MGLATPTALMVGTGVGAAKGILIRSGAAIQTMRDIDTVCLDKTGTLTHGRPEVVDIASGKSSPDTVLTIAASVDSASEHPIAAAFVRAAKAKGLTFESSTGFQAFPGKGVSAAVNGQTVLVGKEAFLNESDIDTTRLEKTIFDYQEAAKTVVLVAVDNQAIGAIAVADTLKPDARQVVAALQARAMHVVMISGDNERTAKTIAIQTGIKRVLGDVLPADKADAIRELQDEGKKVAMVGDGINDAAALVQADIGIAIGTGTDVAIESADVTLVKGDLTSLVEAIDLSEATFSKIKQNLFWAFGYNMLAVPLAIMGLLHPLIAEAAMALSSFNVVINSLRLRVVLKRN
jgi:Cu+-exporting ATPase